VQRVSVGLGVRDAYGSELLAIRDRGVLDVLEVMIDDGLEASPRLETWRRLGARWPLIAHGTELGIASAEPPDPGYLKRVAKALGRAHVHWYSEHLAFVATKDTALGHFVPLGSSEEELAVLRDNVAAVRARVPVPFLLENPSDILGWEAELGGHSLGARYARSLEVAECGALLDLTNLLLDAKNDGWDPMHFLDAMDLERVVQIHVAGGRFDGALHIDSHDHDVTDETWDLLAHVGARASQLRAVIIERDDRLPPLDALLGEVSRARAALAKAGRA